MVIYFFNFSMKTIYCRYSKCPKISYTKVSDEIASANSVVPDQTAPLSILRNNCTKAAQKARIRQKKIE